MFLSMALASAVALFASVAHAHDLHVNPAAPAFRGSGGGTPTCATRPGFEGTPACDACDNFQDSHYLWFQQPAEKALEDEGCTIWKYGCEVECSQKSKCSAAPVCNTVTTNKCSRACPSTEPCQRVCSDAACIATCAMGAAAEFSVPVVATRTTTVPMGGVCPPEPAASCKTNCSTDHCSLQKRRLKSVAGTPAADAATSPRTRPADGPRPARRPRDAVQRTERAPRPEDDARAPRSAPSPRRTDGPRARPLRPVDGPRPARDQVTTGNASMSRKLAQIFRDAEVEAQDAETEDAEPEAQDERDAPRAPRRERDPRPVDSPRAPRRARDPRPVDAPRPPRDGADADAIEGGASDSPDDMNEQSDEMDDDEIDEDSDDEDSVESDDENSDDDEMDDDEINEDLDEEDALDAMEDEREREARPVDVPGAPRDGADETGMYGGASGDLEALAPQTTDIDGGVLDQSFQELDAATAPAPVEASDFEQEELECHTECVETCANAEDSCEGDVAVAFTVQGTDDETIDPSDDGCEIECLDQEQDCTSSCMLPEDCPEECEMVEEEECEYTEDCTMEEECAARCNELDQFSYCFCQTQ